MSDPESLTGLWEGAYAFSTAELGECPFKVRMREEDGTLRGMVVEQHTEKDEQVRAEFEGTREGHAIEWVKAYVNNAPPYHRTVRYTGELNLAGDRLNGAWHLPDDSGTFHMRRVS